MGFDKCVDCCGYNPPGSSNVMAKGGQLIYYDKLMLWYEEKNLERALPPIYQVLFHQG